MSKSPVHCIGLFFQKIDGAIHLNLMGCTVNYKQIQKFIICILPADFHHLAPIVAQHSEELIILKPDDIYMVRVEDGNTMIYGGNEVYYSRKRLYELKAQLGTKFMQISKCSLVNLKYLSSVEPGFSGTLLLKLKNGSKEYVSRKYLSDFKHYLGL